MSSRSRILRRGGLALAAVLGGSTIYAVPHTHRDLTQEALRHVAVEVGAAPAFQGQPHHKEDVLATLAPYGITNLTLSGHKATITGAARPDDEIERIKQSVIRWGVADAEYKVDPNATINGASSNASSAIDMTAQLTGGKIVLKGVVLSEAERKTLVDAATKAYGAGNVVDQLTIATPAAAANAKADTYVSSFASMLALSGKAISLTGSIKGSAVDLSAAFPSAPDQAAYAPLSKAATDAGGAVKLNLTGGSAASTTAAPTTTAASTTTAAPTTTAAAPATTTTAKPAEDEATKLQKELDALAAVQSQIVFFATGSADLTPEAIATLARAAAVMKQYPNPAIEVSGHTDSDGDDAANLELSQRRADAVRAELIAQGVDAKRLTAVGYGETKPKADNATAEGRAQNRRVEFLVKKGS